MIDKAKVLWIEDSARYELSELAGPVYASRKYHLNIAEDATTATHHLMNGKYDVLIVDMRLPPGEHPAWQEIYRKQGNNKEFSHLGLHLLNWMLKSNQGNLSDIGDPPPWLSPDCIAVFTVESRDQIENVLPQRGLLYEQKRATRRDTALLELIERVMKQQTDKVQ